jgi:hypothetical protein
MDELTRTALATATAFLQSAEAERVVLILDTPEPTMVDVDAFLTAEVTVGETITPVTHADYADADPKALPPVTAVPPQTIDIDVETGEIRAPIGTIEHLAQAVLALATSFGGRTVASVELTTSDPETPITLAARPGDPVILAAGEEQFEV